MAGWQGFIGGGVEPDFCATEPPVIEPTPNPNAPIRLSCTAEEYALDLTIRGGAPPFIWVATAGVLTVTGLRTATIAIHELGSLATFYKPVLTYSAQDCAGLSPCLGTGQPMRTEVITQTYLRSLDCLGLDIGLGEDLILGPDDDPLLAGKAMTVLGFGVVEHPIGDNLAIDSDHYITASWSGTPISVIGTCNPHDITAWHSGKCECTVDEDKEQSVTAMVVTAGKNGANGTVWSGAVPFSETKNFPVARGACQIDATPGNFGNINFDGLIDVRTQTMVDEDCCVSPIGVPIVVTVTDAEGNVVFLNIPVV